MTHDRSADRAPCVAAARAGYLSRQLKLAYAESPYSYPVARRSERAMALLCGGELSVTEICFAVGCQPLGTFSLRFSELVGVPRPVRIGEANVA